MIIKTRMTAAEYFDLAEMTPRAQLIHGELIEMPSPDIEHQRAVRRLLRLFEQMIAQIGGEVFIAPMDVEFDKENVVQPDVFWIAANGKCKPSAKNRLTGPPDLIAEVLSPSTTRVDRTEKFLLYEKYGVREYWIIDPQRQYLEVWRLEGSAYMLQGSYGMGEIFVSAVLNRVNIDPAVVFAAP